MSSSLAEQGQILDVIEEREIQSIMPLQFFFRWNTRTKIFLNPDLAITSLFSLNLQKRAVRCPGKIEEMKNPDGTITAIVEGIKTAEAGK